MTWLPDTEEEIRDFLLEQLSLGEKDVDDIFKMFAKIDTASSLEVLERMGTTIAKQRLDEVLEIFYNQPSQVILWSPDKRYYAWMYPFTAKGGEMLHKILEIVLPSRNLDKQRTQP